MSSETPDRAAQRHTAADPLGPARVIAEPSESSSPLGKGRWTALGATFGFAPPICTSSLTLLDKLSLPNWLIVTVYLVSPIIGALLGLLSYVVVARTDRESIVNQAQVKAAADAVRRSIREGMELKPNYILEVTMTRIPNGFQSTIHYYKEPVNQIPRSAEHTVSKTSVAVQERGASKNTRATVTKTAPEEEHQGAG